MVAAYLNGPYASLLATEDPFISLLISGTRHSLKIIAMWWIMTFMVESII